MKVYIAGKITGEPDYRKRFRVAEEYFQRSGDIVFNPATLPEGMTAADYMALCIPMMLRADLVAFLPNCWESRGAHIEFELCEYVGKQSAFLAYWPEFMDAWERANGKNA